MYLLQSVAALNQVLLRPYAEIYFSAWQPLQQIAMIIHCCKTVMNTYGSLLAFKISLSVCLLLRRQYPVTYKRITMAVYYTTWRHRKISNYNKVLVHLPSFHTSLLFPIDVYTPFISGSRFHIHRKIE